MYSLQVLEWYEYYTRFLCQTLLFCGYFHLDLKRWDGDETHEPRPWKGARLVMETAAVLAFSATPRKVHCSFLNISDSDRDNQRRKSYLIQAIRAGATGVASWCIHFFEQTILRGMLVKKKILTDKICDIFP